MKSKVIRGCSGGVLVILAIVTMPFIGLSVFTLCLIFFEQMPLEEQVSLWICGTLGFLISTAILMFGVHDYFTNIQLHTDKITFSSPFFKKQFLFDQVTVFGLVSYMARGGMLFFLTEKPEELLEYLDSHWNECVRIHGKDCCDRLKKSEKGMLQLAVGTYLKYQADSRNKKVILLRTGTAQMLKQIVQLLGRDALLAGPMILQNEDGWKKFTRFE